ncbi:MAG: substrate-binding domain-containing protein [Dokdonella sp.]
MTRFRILPTALIALSSLLIPSLLFAADPPPAALKPASKPASSKPAPDFGSVTGSTGPAAPAKIVSATTTPAKPTAAKATPAKAASAKKATADASAAGSKPAKPSTAKATRYSGKATTKAAPISAANTLVWRGDLATARGIIIDLAKQYEKDRKVHIALEPFSTVSGIDAVSAGRADLAGSARPMFGSRDEEKNLNFVPTALDAIVPITNPRNPVNNLSLRQVRQIYLGKIKNWKDVGGNDAEINLYSVAAPTDGIEYSMRYLIYRKGDQRISAPRLYLNTGSLEEAVTLDANSLGLSTLSGVWNRKDIKMLSVSGIPASTSSISNGTYPLYTTLFLVTRFVDLRQAMVDDFVAYLTTPDAKDIMRRHQLVPYVDAADLVARAPEQLQMIDADMAKDVAAETAASPPTSTVLETPTPISAPQATLAAKAAIAPAAESTEQARVRAAEAAAKKNQQTDPATGG